MVKHFLIISKILALTLSVFASTNTNAQSISRLLVPAYGNPCCDGGASLWQGLISWAEESPNTLSVIVNPFNGPGASPIDPNYINNAGRGPLVDLYRSGAELYGYIFTSHAQRNLNEVFTDIERFTQSTYYRNTGVQLSGFFIDEMSNDLANINYYRQIRNFIASLDADLNIIGNPGVSSIVDHQGLGDAAIAEYATMFNTLVVFENDFSSYTRSYSAPVWQSGLPAASFAHIVHGTNGINELNQALLLANMRGAGLVYITDDVLFNPYDQLPSYFLQIRNYFENMPDQQCSGLQLIGGDLQDRHILPFPGIFGVNSPG